MDGWEVESEVGREEESEVGRCVHGFPQVEPSVERSK